MWASGRGAVLDGRISSLEKHSRLSRLMTDRLRRGVHRFVIENELLTAEMKRTEAIALSLRDRVRRAPPNQPEWLASHSGASRERFNPTRLDAAPSGRALLSLTPAGRFSLAVSVAEAFV
jgi:hypothetical protein